MSYFYIVSAVLFILGLKGLSSPKWARLGMFLAEFGMLLAVVGTLFHHDIQSYRWIALGLLLGTVDRRRHGLVDPDDGRAAADGPVALARGAGGHADRHRRVLLAATARHVRSAAC